MVHEKESGKSGGLWSAALIIINKVEISRVHVFIKLIENFMQYGVDTEVFLI